MIRTDRTGTGAASKSMDDERRQDGASDGRPGDLTMMIMKHSLQIRKPNRGGSRRESVARSLGARVRLSLLTSQTAQWPFDRLGRVQCRSQSAAEERHRMQCPIDTTSALASVAIALREYRPVGRTGWTAGEERRWSVRSRSGAEKGTFPFPCLASAILQVISKVALRRSPEYYALRDAVRGTSYMGWP